MLGGWHGTEYHIHDGPRLPASPPMRTAFGTEWGQSNAGNICTGVMPSPPRIIAGASTIIYIRHRLIEDKNKIETIVVFKLLYFRLGGEKLMEKMGAVSL